GWIAFVHTVALKGSWWVIPYGALIARQKILMAALQVGNYRAGPDGYNGARRRQDLNDRKSGCRPPGRNPGSRSGSRGRGGVLPAGDSGDGMQLTGGQFTLSTALAGNDLATFPDFPAEIRAPQGTLFGVSAFQINFGSTQIDTAGDAPDVLVAMNPAALKVNL